MIQRTINECRKQLEIAGKFESAYMVDTYRSSKSGKWHLSIPDSRWSKANRGLLCGRSVRDVYHNSKKPFVSFNGTDSELAGPNSYFAGRYLGKVLATPIQQPAEKINCHFCKDIINKVTMALCMVNRFDWDPDSLLIVRDFYEEIGHDENVMFLELKSAIGWLDSGGNYFVRYNERLDRQSRLSLHNGSLRP